MSTTPEEQLKSILDQLAARNLVKIKAKRKTEPYYKEEHALWFRDNVLVPIKNGKSVTISINPNMKIGTIACLLSQSRKYLFKELDPDGIWFAVWDNTWTIERNPRYYKFSPKVSINNALSVVTCVDFYSALSEYLNTLSKFEDGRAVFERTGLNMTDEDVDKINGMLHPYTENLTYFLDRTQLKIINIPTT